MWGLQGNTISSVLSPTGCRRISALPGAPPPPPTHLLTLVFTLFLLLFFASPLGFLTFLHFLKYIHTERFFPQLLWELLFIFQAYNYNYFPCLCYLLRLFWVFFNIILLFTYSSSSTILLHSVHQKLFFPISSDFILFPLASSVKIQNIHLLN